MQMHWHVESIMWDDRAVDDFVERINLYEADDIILSCVHEGFPFQLWQNNYKRLITNIKKKNNRIFFVVADCHNVNDINQMHVPAVSDIFVTNYFAYLAGIPSWVTCDHHGSNLLDWNPKGEKFLYLNGTDRPWRFWLFYKMSQTLDLENKAMYSYHPNVDYAEVLGACESLYLNSVESAHVKGLTQEVYQQFCKRWHRDLDPVPFRSHRLLRLDHTWWQDSLFCLVVESNFHTNWPHPWCTEKTYTAMIYHRPFIVASEVKYLERLRRDGFITFEDMLPHKNYDSIVDPFERIDAICQNTDYFSRNIRNLSEKIQFAVKHNYRTLIKNAEHTAIELDHFIKKHGLEQDRDGILPIGPRWVDVDWQIFYNNIKDKDWPPCQLLYQLDSLPDYVKKTCMEDPWMPEFIAKHQNVYFRLPRCWVDT